MTSALDRVRELLEREATWPPPEMKTHWEAIQGYRRRYRNSRQELIEANPNIMVDDHKVETFVPVPWPRELCRFSSALLFSESPRITSEANKEAIDRLVEVNDLGAFAIRGGVKTAVEGRVGIRIIRDDIIDPEVPLLTLVPEDQIIWDIRHGSFYCGGVVIIEHRPHEKERKTVYRLLEEHAVGSVERHLYKGQDRELGKEVPLDSVREFSGLAPVTFTGLNKPTLVPWENVPGAESDMFGLGPLFDELNLAESTLLDRSLKSQPRVFVDRALADETGRLQIDGYILVGASKMRVPLGQNPGQQINVVQPAFMSAEHIMWFDHISQLIVTTAGYSPSTWGIQGQTASIQRAVSGYAMKLAQLRTLLSRSAKEHMALQALGWAVACATAWMTGTNDVSKLLPSIELGDGLPNDPLDGAQEVLFLQQAAAASIEERVKIVHSTWAPSEIQAEVDRIMAEITPPTTAAGPAAGIGKVSPRVQKILEDADAFVAGDGVDSGATPVG